MQSAYSHAFCLYTSRPVILDEQVKQAFAALGDEYADVSARLFADDPHLSVDPLDDDQ